jgi:uncharacterized protein (DUF2336 family)
VGLTAHDMSDMSRLAQLAINPRDGATREEIYLAVASLYRIQGAGLNGRERELMREILHRLTHDVEMAIRIALAQRLADDTAAPPDLILLLVDDTIEVARPLILNSPLLTEADMLRLIAQASTGHQEAVASRPHIGVALTDALAKSNTESVLLALIRNATATISDAGYETLAAKARSFARLQEPLVRRSDMPAPIANKMCEWVSDALKTYIRTNYSIAPQRVDSALHEAIHAVTGKPPAASDNPASNAHRLIDKLAASNQLKAGFLMRVLSQGHTDLFDLGFARLLDMDLGLFRRQFYEDGTLSVALCCRAVGIDRSVFPTVFDLSRQARGRHIALSEADIAQTERLFIRHTRKSALEQLRGMIPN